MLRQEFPGDGTWSSFERGGVHLEVLEHPGPNPPLVFLHGLAGHAGEWGAVRASLGGRFRTLGLDQRGHGRSERHPRDVSRAACVDDVIALIGSCCPGQPVCLIGQSLGGHTAFLAASARPDLVRSLVVVEATAGGPDEAAVERLRGWLNSWPRPFATRAEALEFFGGGDPGDAWVAGLEHRADGLWPRFDDEVMLTTLEASESRSWWAEWGAIVCPTLLVSGANGWLSDDDVQRMQEALPIARLATVPAAGHDVHLDAPEALSELLVDFLKEGR